MIEIVTSNIIKKAELEKNYNILYGRLCESLIKIELQLKGLDSKIQTMKDSQIRKYLLKFCKERYDNFFDQR
jgi:hypothetical protein